MKNYSLAKWVRVMLILSGLALVAVLFVPMWQIQLYAPQYPEGLVLKIYPNKLGGNVDIINGLNHYIGMKTLHTEDFIEFTILPFIIVFFAVLCFIAALLNRKRWLIFLTVLFIIFGVVAMVDFWRWEYNYGHDLDPQAAIKVPGMAYQPPLIGYKQLLNFGAYSIPDTGGFIFIAVGVALLLTTIMELIKSKRDRKTSGIYKKGVAKAMAFLLIFSASCNTGPQPIKIGTDACSFCKMTISDNRFGGEIITKKGKVYKFDDLHCLVTFKKSGALNGEEINHIYLVRFDGTHNFIDASKALLFKSGELRTPMGSNIAAFENEQSLSSTAKNFKGTVVSWNDLVK
jgi:copper chaperone NosL